MNDGELPWMQFTLIIELAERMRDRPFGRTALQKLTYLLQELHGVGTEYEFPLHTYGPYSSGLAADLHRLAVKQALEVDDDPRHGRAKISPGPKREWIRALGDDALRPHLDAISAVVDEFGGMTTKELELRATLVFVERDARRRGTRLAEDTLVEEVHEIKPNFSREQILAALREMRDRGHIATA